MRLEKGLFRPIPIILAISKEKAIEIRESQRIVLVNSVNDEIMASMLVEEKYSYDKRIEALEIFGMDDERHPGIDKISEQGDVYLGEPASVFSENEYAERFPEFARLVTIL